MHPTKIEVFSQKILDGDCEDAFLKMLFKLSECQEIPTLSHLQSRKILQSVGYVPNISSLL